MARQMPYPAELAQLSEHFASGVNHPGEVRGLALSARHVGITATRVSDALLEELAIFGGAGSLQRLFVDSGAFSEVAFDPAAGRLVVVAPISDEAWKARFALYRWAAANYGRRAYLVAPDLVGDQVATLDRLERYAADIQVCAAVRANIIVPVQKGELAMSEMFRRSCEMLGLRNLIAGIPMKKDATSLADLEELLHSLPRSRPTETRQGARIHLLGLGPESPRFAAVIALIKRIRPHALITSDSVTVRRLAGRTNGPGGGPRALTRYSDEARSRGMTEAFDVKSFALIAQGFDELTEERERAAALGWFDAELAGEEEEPEALPFAQAAAAA